MLVVATAAAGANAPLTRPFVSAVMNGAYRRFMHRSCGRALLLFVSALLTGCRPGAGAPQAPPPAHVIAAPATTEMRSSDSSGLAAPTAPTTPVVGTSAWRITRPAAVGTLEGYVGASSVLPGRSVNLMVSTTFPVFRVVAYRLGWYDGKLGTRVWRSAPVTGTQQAPPQLLADTNTVVAGWAPSLRISTAGWDAGVYLLQLVASTGEQADVPLVVRSASTVGKVVLVAPTVTWQAYNDWGGYSLYHGPAPDVRRSWAVSFDRPYEAPGAARVLFSALPVIARAERLGIGLAYLTDVDLDLQPTALAGAAGCIVMGHSEYWSVPMRREVTAARNAGTNLAFLSANTMYWRVRLTDTSTGPDRLVVGYKSDAEAADPARYRHPATTTTRWRDPPHPRPENSIVGMLYECYPVDAAYVIVTPHWWAFHGMHLRRGESIDHLVGPEADRVYLFASTPRPLQIVADATFDCGGVPTSSQSTYYTTAAGAGVFTAGTENWTCALDSRCRPHTYSSRARLLTRTVTDNLLRRFSAGPVGSRWPAKDNVSEFLLPPYNTVPAN